MGLFKKSELKKNYELGKDLGSGNFAVVKLATNKSFGKSGNTIPETVAIKVIDKAKVEDMNDIQREIEVMNMLDHPHVIRLYGWYVFEGSLRIISWVIKTATSSTAERCRNQKVREVGQRNDKKHGRRGTYPGSQPVLQGRRRQPFVV